ncbi:hypothetical protein bcCo53_001144 (plasmid) [Borrelia coriaceae]|uniref:Lipoprotein n=1 Tax=Borrelia coriaceae ATCC 43381 TaxID=1408429 RepID=W5SW31_9SPIR|nr:hypothetical protein [Borrelia coriaceae]AHH11150.1 Hypothetical protein BCO_0026100 [Borrelia coriaceae ATCC 43381]UPA16976.1 hypothetical protein bcCo53_001144 [Borrelia coriaceae]
MKKMSMLVCIFGILGCGVSRESSVNVSMSTGFRRDVGSLVPSIPPPPRTRYPQVVVAYDALMVSLSALKASYNENRDSFLPRKSSFDDNIFNQFEADLGSDEARDDVYASLKHEVVSLENLELVINILTSFGENQLNREFALRLLYRLRASAMYIREVIDEDEGILNQDNLNVLLLSNDLKGITLLKSYLDEMLNLRNVVVDMAKGMLLSAAGAVDDVEVLSLLASIINSQGALKESINSSAKQSLRDLRTKIEHSVNDLVLGVVRAKF